ncbi:MAG: response regulator [Spirochaetes bacterium]|nr:response regulator [Spirochaetota bacterium]
MKRILFVDDEIYLLEALKRILRNKTDWDTTFVSGAKEALELMNNTPFDIIVADYKMPEMDGLELLAIVKEKFNNVKRIILSGQAESEIHNKAKAIAHVYLPKPCEPEVLIATIEKFNTE